MQPGPPVVLDCSKTNNFYDHQIATTSPPAANPAGVNCAPPFGASNFNYTNLSQLQETFQTSTGACLTVSFNTIGPSLFGIGPGDTLWLYDGPTISSSLIQMWTNTPTQPTSVYTSTSAGGLTFRFKSDSAGNCKGWAVRFGCVTCPSAPSNDPCSNAQQLIPGASCIYTPGFINAPTISTAGMPSCGGSIPNNNDDVWYYFVANQNNATVTIPASAGFDPVIQLLQGTCGSLSAVAGVPCANANGVGLGEILSATGLTIGTTYYIRIFDYNGAGGAGSYTFNICVVSTAPTDCAGANHICSTVPYNGLFIWNSYGIQEYTAGTFGCILYGESTSAWFYWQCQTSGTLALNIASSNGTYQDIDFALWGNMNSMSCPMVAQPLRCSYAGPFFSNSYGMPSYSTGLEVAPGHITEPAGYAFGNTGFVDTITMQAGKYYVLMLNLWTGNLNYQLTFQLTHGAAISNCVALLPIELVSFNGENLGAVNHLFWTTQSEINNDHFVLERSADGSNFNDIGIIRSDGNSSVATNYDYYDQHPLDGTNYYRLRQVDLNGVSTYSEIISLENNSVGSTSLAVYPNPTAGIFNVSLNAQENCIVSIDVLNDIGQIIQTMQKEISTGVNNIEVDLTTFPRGVYTVKVRACDIGKVFTKKIVKL